MLSGELNAYMTALKVEELDIDKVEVTLENMRHLSNVKEYSVTKVNLKEIGSVSSTITITAWTVVVLIGLLVVATCCKCCAPCQTIGTVVLDLLKCLFGGMRSLCECLIRRKKSQPSGEKENKRKLVAQPSMRKRFRKGKRRMGLDESVSASKASMDTVSESLDDIERVLDWSVKYEKDRVMITAMLNGVELILIRVPGK